MESTQDDVVARRREQNRMAQRRFRWKKSQQKDPTREPERRRKSGMARSQESSEQQQRNESTPAVTPSPSNDGMEAIPPVDMFPLSFDNTTNLDYGSMSTSAGTNSLSSAAHATAMGMGGLLEDHGVIDFTDLGVISPSPSASDTYPARGLEAHKGDGSVPLEPSEKAAMAGKDAARVDGTTLDWNHCQTGLRYQTLENQVSPQAVNPRQVSRPGSSFPGASRSTASTPEHLGRLTPSSRSQPGSTSHLGLDPERGWLGPLHLAAAKGHNRIVRMLLKRQPSVNEPDSDGLTALMHAVRGGFEDVTRSLLDAGAAVDDADRHGRTALHWAVLGRHEAMLRQLLEHSVTVGANLDLYDGEGRTPLHRAIESGFEAGLQLLLDFGGDFRCKVQKPI